MARRLPGQSIRDEKEKLMDNRFIPFYFATVGLWFLFAWEELRAHHYLSPSPRALLIAGIFGTAITALVIRGVYSKFRILNRGERGELEAADALENLRGYGYKIVHDVVGDGFNVDHVVVGPSGVYAVETKFRSSSGEVTFRNGEGLFIGGKPDERNCLKQARWNARSIHGMIQERCGFYQWVKPLVVFTGNVQIRDEWSETDLRVFTPAKAVKYIAAQQPELTRKEINAIATNLEAAGKK